MTNNINFQLKIYNNKSMGKIEKLKKIDLTLILKIITIK